MAASKTKLNAPFAHTFLQVVRVRWGKSLHLVTMVFALTVNILVGSMLILGGSATVHQLTGMPVLAAVFLTPIAVALYTLTGGLRSTFLADYIHTTVLVALILMFSIYTYAVSDKIGSAEAMYTLLQQAPAVSRNAAGSYTSFRSLDGLKFGIINICGGFATVFADQSYHQRGIAAAPSVATKGFILGGIAWFAVPTVTASSLGLAARALLGKDPAMALLSDDEVTAGLAAPAAAVALLGKAGAVAMLILLYLAVTSASSAQLIAVSSILTFDVWKSYLNPSASPRQLFVVSHVCVALWAVALGILGCIWNAVGVSMGYLYLLQAIMTAPAVFPIFACLTWSKANKNGALVGMVLGIAGGIAVWLGIAYAQYGALDIESTGANDPTMAGSLVSLLVPTFVTTVWSLLWPQSYTFEETRAINASEAINTMREEEKSQQEHAVRAIGSEAGHGTASFTPTATGSHENVQDNLPEDDKKKDASKEEGDRSAPVATLEHDLAPSTEGAPESHDGFYYVRRAGLDPIKLQACVKSAILLSLPMSFLITIFIPCMAIIPRDYGPTGLGAWVGVMMVWMFGTAFIVIALPVWESWHALKLISAGMCADVTTMGKGRRNVHHGAD